jgi:hypothetical protein
MTAARNGIAARMKRVAYMVLDGSGVFFFWGKEVVRVFVMGN